MAAIQTSALKKITVSRKESDNLAVTSANVVRFTGEENRAADVETNVRKAIAPYAIIA